MKTSKIYLGALIVIMTAAFTLTSCHKKDKTNAQQSDTEQSTATDHNMAENNANDIDAIGSQVGDAGSLSTYRTDGVSEVEGISSATITGVSTKTITVDFGTATTGSDGRVRSGKLVYNFSASSPTTAIHYRNPGFSMSVSSINYVVDGNQVNIINKTVTNTTPLSLPTGPNPGTNLTWAISANISIVKANNAGTITWTCNRTKELINTSDITCYNGQSVAITWTNAKVKLNGSASGTNAKSESFTATATDLVRDFTCHPDGKRRPFVSGKIAYTPGSRPERLIDFGNGACDLAATVTINGQTFAITLP